MSTSIMLDLSRQLGLICCHKAHQHHVTPEIKLIRFAQQTCRSNTSICPKQGKTENLAVFILVALHWAFALCVLLAQAQDTVLWTCHCDNTRNQLQQKLTDLAQGVGIPNLFPSLIYLPHLEKGNRLSEAVGSKMIWSSILLNWLLPV